MSLGSTSAKCWKKASNTKSGPGCMLDAVAASMVSDAVAAWMGSDKSDAAAFATVGNRDT